MKRIVTAITLAVASCAAAPVAAQSMAVMAEAENLCDAIEVFSRNAYNNREHTTRQDVMDFAVRRGAMNRFVLDAIDGVYYGGFSSAEEAASMNGHECRLNIYSEIARAILQ